MEAILSVFQTPGGSLAVELILVVLVGWMIRDNKAARKAMHERIDALNNAFGERIQELTGKLHDHEVRDANRWGRVQEKLKIGVDSP